MTPKSMRDAIHKIRDRTEKPFAVNLFAVDMRDNFSRLDEVQLVLDRFRKELGMNKGGEGRTIERFSEQFQVVIEEKVSVLSTAFGVLQDPDLQEFKKRGMLLTVMVTTVNEARIAEESGADCHCCSRK